MTAARLRYRTRQFWNYLGAKTPPVDEGQVRQVLGARLAEVFARLQPGEQAHCFQVYRRLAERGESDPDLLAAALLHDAGKSRFPLRLWERVWIVVGKALLPKQAQDWGQSWNEAQGAPAGLRRAFVIAEQHPAWGARMAEEAGAREQVVRLIRRHQERLPQDRAFSREERRLLALQSVDDEN
jgi:hypothetical protein